MMATYNYNLSRDISWFLIKNPAIGSINFKLRSFKVYPTAYRRDVAYALKGERIRVRIKKLDPGLGAQYYNGLDELCLSPSFKLSNYRDQAYLIHECTHAHLDIQNSGYHLFHENEAVGYVAEAIFLESIRKQPLSQHRIRLLSHEIAKRILAGQYVVSEPDTKALVLEISKHPGYTKRLVMKSDGVWTWKSWFNPSK
jgi:hypothetical protein